MQLEPTQPMSCSVSKHFQAVNNIGIVNQTLSSIDANFELSSKDISLVSISVYSHFFRFMFETLIPVSSYVCL